MAQSHQQKRKKWKEEEERTLIEKYSSMISDGSLSRLRTREKKFRPIAAHVNSLHHSLDPSAFPFLWSWKDACTKVQNMRHQYLLVKQKIQSTTTTSSAAAAVFRWEDGENYWSNFLRYKQVFGDHPLPVADNSTLPIDEDRELGFGGEEEEFDYTDVIPQDPSPPTPAAVVWRRKGKKRKVRGLLERTEERERWRRREEEEEREWEERMEVRREEWRKRMEGVMAQHRVDMEQMQARMMNEQQSFINQLLGMVGQLGSGGLGYGVVVGGQQQHQQQQQQPQQHHAFVSQMMHSFHNVNGMVQEENRVEGDSQDDQFIVDG